LNTYYKFLSVNFILFSIFVSACNELQIKEGSQPTEQVSSQGSPGQSETVNIQGLVKDFPDIFFAKGSTHLSMKARKQIQEIARLLNHPDLINQTIIIEGHSDASGDAHYNIILSRKRAETVSRELVVNGVRDSRLILRALGESQPIDSNWTDDRRADPQTSSLNRRVEIILDTMDLAKGHL